jgi:5-methyltetrahydrofolate--homocysteine methyltransferase
MDSMIEEIYDTIINGQKEKTCAAVQVAIDAGVVPVEILNQGMIAAMAEVGRLFECGDYYVPEMLIAARAMQAGLAILKPHLAPADRQSVGKVVLGTVQGDLHDIGKNLVGMMLEGAGFEIQDLGVNVAPENFITAVSAGGVDIVALSALLTTTMPNMKIVIDSLRAAGFQGQFKVMIGGAPVTEDYARQIGADGFAVDASRAVTMAKSLLAMK